VRLSVGGSGQSEPQAAKASIEPGVIYVADRGFENLSYVNAVLAGRADFVLRARSTLKIDVREALPLDADDMQAGVLSDRIVQLPASAHARARKAAPQQQLREVVVFDPHHPDKPLKLITSLLDVPAQVIAQLYQRRWQIELFFRWLKVHAHFRHLISRSQSGMTMGFYVAVIAVLLMYLRTGRPMSLYAYNLLSFLAAGQGSLETTLAILERRERECDRERKRRRAKQAAKNHA
jgi:transposase